MNKILLGSLIGVLLLTSFAIGSSDIDWFKLYEEKAIQLASCEVERDIWAEAYENKECACSGGSGGPSPEPEVPEEQEVLMGDANCDGVVSSSDLALANQNFGNVCNGTEECCFGDANHDGIVSAGDIASVQANFGNTL